MVHAVYTNWKGKTRARRMLTSGERELIEKNMSSFSQIVELISPVFGEPFLYNGYLYYFDGSTITFYPERIIGEGDMGSLGQTLKRIIKKHRPLGVIVWGHAKEEPSFNIEGYEVYYKEELPFYYTELRVLEPKPSKKMKKAINRAKREGYRYEVSKLKEYRAEWLKLLAETHENKIDLEALRLVLWYAMYPLSKKTKVLEVQKDDEIIGIQIVYDNSPRYVCLAEIGYNKNVKRSAEVVEALAVNEYLDVEILSLGGSPTEGVFRQKIELFRDPKILYEGVPLWWVEYRRKGTNWDNSWWFERMLKMAD